MGTQKQVFCRLVNGTKVIAEHKIPNKRSEELLMKKKFVFLLMFIIAFTMICCSSNSNEDELIVADYDTNIPVTLDAAQDAAMQNTEECTQNIIEFAAVMPENSTDSLVNSEQSDVLSVIVREYGYPFRLFCGTNKDVFEFQVYENYATLSTDTKPDGNIMTYDFLLWEISGTQLTFTGEWDEAFTINIDDFSATSNITQKVYHIFPAQDGVNRYNR